ncbi:MAG: DUF4253 domain-containing protein [Candidatus Obscuribacterales bacterium]|nr:DUF4253 domain-containing protein [Candidatus Obscuribacterales bacterium]
MEFWKSELSLILKEITSCSVIQNGFNDHGRELQKDAISVILPANGKGDELFAIATRYLHQIRGSIPANFVAYIGTTQWITSKVSEGIEIAIGPGVSQFDIIRLANTSAPNYDLQTEDLIRPLIQFDTEYGIDVIHAEADSLSFELAHPPSDTKRFAKELFQYCEDLSQGDLNEDELAEVLKHEKLVRLWWD